MVCPKCRLENPEEAMICDCGYNFESRLQESPLITNNAEPSKTLKTFGWIFSILGGLIGIAIASEIIYSTKKGQYKYSEKARREGKIMLVVAIAIFSIGFIIKYLLR